MRPARGEPVLEGRGLFFRYEPALPDVVKGLDITVYRGEFVALLGGNGAGKTTSLHLLSGALTPQRGEVKRTGRIGALPQNPQALFVKKTVREDLYEVFDGQRIDPALKEQRIAQAVSLCRLTELLDRHPYDLSGGEQQRAALCKVLLLDPEILLLDEPTKGLDAYAKAELAQLLLALCREGASILVVTHDVEFAARYATGCALMFDGLLLSEGEPHDFFAGNRFYTTDANRIAAEHFPMDITCEEVIASCRSSLSAAAPEPPRG